MDFSILDSTYAFCFPLFSQSSVLSKAALRVVSFEFPMT